MNTPGTDPIGIVRTLLADGVEVGDARRSGALTLLTLTGGPTAPAYLTAREALDGGTLQIGEIGVGTVPQLIVRNTGTLPALFVGGEHLEGAMQDRVLNVSVLVAPKHNTVIPVSCVERGRWHYRPAPEEHDVPGKHQGEPMGFRSSSFSSPSRLRGMAADQVAAALRAGGGPDVDQGDVWRDVEAMGMALGEEPSLTGALGDTYRDRADDLDRVVKEVGKPKGANGVLAFVGWRPLAMDLFDRPQRLKAVWKQLIRGYAIDALGAEPADVGPEFARGFLSGLAAPNTHATSHEGVGLGRDVILTSPTTVVDALVWQGAAVHLAAFPKGERLRRS